MSKHRFQFMVLLSLFAALCLLSGTVGAAPQNAALVSLSAAKSAYSASEDVLVNVTYTNATGHTIRILKWFTPMDGVEEPVFIVNVNGKSVDYVGAIYKRPAPTGSDYLTLKSSESITYSVNLAEYYDLSATGKYRLFYKASSYQLFDEKGSDKAEVIASDAITFKVEGRAKPRPTSTPTPPPGPSTSFNVCTTDQQSKLLTARANAITYSTNAEDYLKTSTVSSRYTTWFGTYLATRYSLVTTHFTAIRDAFVTKPITFDCKCKQNYYAYVYPTQPYVIYLCKVFWTAPATGTDSQFGTLIHEMSHFDVVASTDDFVYGQTGAKALAISNPDQAVNNADNHEYFAENTPTLP